MKAYSFLGTFLISFLLLTLCFVSTYADPNWAVQTVDVNGAGFAMGSCPIALDSSNNPHIAYTGFANSTTFVMYASWNGSGWSTQIVAYGAVFDLVLDVYGNPHILFIKSNPGGGYLGQKGLSYASWAELNWTIQTVDQEFVRGFGSVALDSSGNPHIAYADIPYGNVVSMVNYAIWEGSNWNVQRVDTAGTTSEYFLGSVSLELDSNNTPYVMYGIYYQENGTESAKIAVYNDSKWNIQTVASNLVGFGNMVLDSKDHPHLTYQSAR